jgi:uncharacterized membrane protein
MARFQIFLSRRRDIDGQPVPPSRGSFWRLKSFLATLCLASAVIGLLLAALVFGSIIAALLLILVAVTFAIAAVRAAVRRAMR